MNKKFKKKLTLSFDCVYFTCHCHCDHVTTPTPNPNLNPCPEFHPSLSGHDATQPLTGQARLTGLERRTNVEHCGWTNMTSNTHKYGTYFPCAFGVRSLCDCRGVYRTRKRTPPPTLGLVTSSDWSHLLLSFDCRRVSSAL